MPVVSRKRLRLCSAACLIRKFSGRCCVDSSSGIVITVTIDKNVDRIGKLTACNVCADLTKGYREEVDLLELQSLIGCNEHSATLVQLDKVFLGADCSFGNLGALVNVDK